MPRGHNIRWWITGKRTWQEGYGAGEKPTFYYMCAETWKDGSTFSLSLSRPRARTHIHIPHRSIASATLIFDKCHVGCHRSPLSLRCVEGTIDFGRGSIRNCQLRRLLHGEMSSAINFRSEQWSFHEGFWYKSVPLFLHHMVSQLSLYELTLVRLSILRFPNLYFPSWVIKPPIVEICTFG